jgi:serine/threonine protein phosphatase PrpC
MRVIETSRRVQFEVAKISLPGNRQENQDRVDVVSNRDAALIVAVDGMGGHAEGAKASELTVSILQQCFASAGQHVLDPQGFLTLALGQAHDRVVALGDGIALEHRPRATCAVCLVQDGNAYCAHVGDSRVYQIRAGAIVSRSRDHSHVELLLREGLIQEHEMKNHPMRNFVECCLGGDQPIPDMSIAGRKRLRPGDVLLVCTDGLWSGLDDASVARLSDDSATLESKLRELAEAAVADNAPHSDNTSAVALRWNGND